MRSRTGFQPVWAGFQPEDKRGSGWKPSKPGWKPVLLRCGDADFGVRDEIFRRTRLPVTPAGRLRHSRAMLLVKTRVAPSAIHGLGLFAAEFIPRGAAVWRFAPGFDREFPPEAFAALPSAAQAHTRWFAFVDRASGRWILSGDHACFMNHAPTPNTGAAVNSLPPITTVTLRDIAAGEELTCDYRAFDAEAGWKLGTDATR